MKILLAAATAAEIKPFLDQLRKPVTHLDCEILITGIGLLSASYKLQKQFSINRPDLVVQAGIAGSFDSKYPPGSVIAVKKDRVADLGVRQMKKWNSIFDMGLEKSSAFPYTKAWLVNNNPDLLKKTGLPLVTSISINEITTRKDSIHYYKNDLGAAIESMEGAALHYVSLMENIPFLQVRSVSNYVGERDKKKWKMAEAINELNDFLVNLLSEPFPIKKDLHEI